MLKKRWKDKETGEEFPTEYHALWNRHKIMIKDSYNCGEMGYSKFLKYSSIIFPFFKRAKQYASKIERVA